MSKLSDRFKKDIVEPQAGQVFVEHQVIIEEPPLLDALLEKVNSVPYWNEYPIGQQSYLVKCFVEHSEDKEVDYKALVPYVTEFGALQKLLNNEKVRAVFVKEDKSVYIEIDGRNFDTEIKLSQNMFQYVLNYVQYLQNANVDGYIFEIYKNFVIRKV